MIASQSLIGGGQIRVDISANGRVRAKYRLEGGSAAALLLQLSPEQKLEFFETVTPFDAFFLLKNPMIVRRFGAKPFADLTLYDQIMMIVSILMGIALPKLVESMGIRGAVCAIQR